ncbi:MAG: hydantoinase B/oxoprolinase family protein [Betaproteobacteria bacterium]|nr:hydantoinase B/oxoprolinase family protein [Betaproteobacteria bacterium]
MRKDIHGGIVDKRVDKGADAARDPVLLAIVQKQLDHITHQMGWIMTRTARSPLASESHDFSCFLGTADGQIAAQADGLPIHSGGGGYALKAVLAAYAGDMAEGDVFLMNDPYVAGGNHLPDYTIVRPVFLEGRLCGFVGNRAHQSDIGGGAAGTYNPAATEIFHEGIRLPVLKLVERDTLRRDLWQLLLLNTRCPDLMEGDLGAMLGSVKNGAARFQALLQETGAAAGAALLAAVLDYGERCMRAEIARLPDGVWHGEDGSDTDCFDMVDVPIRVKLTVSGDSLAFDFTGSSPQIRGFKNSSLANTCSAVYVAVAAFFDASVPRNGGTFRPVAIIAPEGSVVNARAPAPLTMNTVFPAVDIIHACWKALAGTDPARACAGWGKSVYGISSGLRDDGRTFVMYHWHASSGTGAVAGRDGFPQAGNLPTLGARTLPNVETYERFYPCRIHRHEFRCDAAGAGQFRGGSSAVYEAEILVASEHAVRAEGLHRPGGYGVHGGGYGAKGTNIVQEHGGKPVCVPQYGMQKLAPMRIRIEGAAGGGWGDPRARDPAAVLRDVRDGVVSLAAARDVYGVAIASDGRSVDSAETARLRQA